MTAADRYLATLTEHLDALMPRIGPELDEVAHRIAASVGDGGVVHVFGSGHSQLVALESAERAGGLAAVNAIADVAVSPTGGRRASAIETLEGYGQIVFDTEDVRAGEVLIVVSNSGINPVPIDVAAAAAARGVFVVAVGSPGHSEASPARDRRGRRLPDVADVTLDTGTPVGDAAVRLDDGAGTGPLSTILAMAVVHALISRCAELLVEAGRTAPLLTSQNLGDTDVNAGVYERYAPRTRRRP